MLSIRNNISAKVVCTDNRPIESFYVLWSFGTVKVGRELVGREMGSWEEGGWKISKEKMAIDLLRQP